jgi:hypothetical protein
MTENQKSVLTLYSISCRNHAPAALRILLALPCRVDRGPIPAVTPGRIMCTMYTMSIMSCMSATCTLGEVGIMRITTAKYR